MSARICPVCGEPLPEPLERGSYIIVEATTGKRRHVMFDWASEHEKCKVVWAGKGFADMVNPGDGAIFLDSWLEYAGEDWDMMGGE